MNLRRIKILLFLIIFLLSACAGQTQVVPPTAALLQPTEGPTETPTDVPATRDPTIFAALEKSRLDPFASNIQDAVFITAMDAFLASGNILEYRIIDSEAFPTEEGKIIVQIYYSIRTTDPSWLVDGGTQVENNWITDKCDRFDFVNTVTEFQLKNRRTCN
ncbi:MAG: hypothetical protein R3307_04615 [Anaerolineales bacterium]|nr:hypothetical protein [Anaerolineales bacterium]